MDAARWRKAAAGLERFVAGSDGSQASDAAGLERLSAPGFFVPARSASWRRRERIKTYVTEATAQRRGRIEAAFRAGIFCSGKEGEPLTPGVYLDIHDQGNGEPDAAGTKKTKRKRACSSGG